MTRPYIQPEDFARIFAPRKEPEAHHAAMMKLNERMARDFNTVLESIERTVK